MPSRRTLSQILVMRLIGVALALSLLMAIFFFSKYVIDTPALGEATMSAEARAIATSLHDGQDPSRWRTYRDYPDAYGFQVFLHRAMPRRQTVAAANVQLVAKVTESLGISGDEDRDLKPGFDLASGPTRQAAADTWLFTARQQVGDTSYWVQIVMVRDPAQLWRGVIVTEMIDHVLVPGCSSYQL